MGKVISLVDIYTNELRLVLSYYGNTFSDKTELCWIIQRIKEVSKPTKFKEINDPLGIPAELLSLKLFEENDHAKRIQIIRDTFNEIIKRDRESRPIINETISNRFVERKEADDGQNSPSSPPRIYCKESAFGNEQEITEG
jgi:hypothetical protein